MFILTCIKKDIVNYPKYLILSTAIECSKKIFYYVISTRLHVSSQSVSKKFNLPNYFIIEYLTINIFENDEKFNLSKLGTDYILNDIGSHFKDECIGAYPDNYVFVIEPKWPNTNKYKVDRRPLKNFKKEF